MNDEQIEGIHVVFGGELKDVRGTDFIDNSMVEIVGIYPNYEEARSIWQARTQQTVDNAQMRFFVVPLAEMVAVGKRYLTDTGYDEFLKVTGGFPRE